MKTLNSSDIRSETRRAIELLRNETSQTQQSIVQTLAVINETQRLIGLLEKMNRAVIRLDGQGYSGVKWNQWDKCPFIC
jgi:hypothetical protein